MYLKFVLVLFFQLFSINNSIFPPNHSIDRPHRNKNVPYLPILPVQRPSMNHNCFKTLLKLN